MENKIIARKRKKINTVIALPVIPDKLYFTIGEVGKLCQVETHVLRYWEEEFSQLAPTKRRGNRRFYQRSDVLLVRRIRELLYIKGFTIEGAKIQLTASAEPLEAQIAQPSKKVLEMLLVEVEDILKDLL